MRTASPRALSAVLHASLLVVLARGTHDGVYARFPLSDRPAGHHLPTYMVHLYRNFTSNVSKPADALEQRGARRADTVKSVMAKSLTYKETRWVATFDLHTLLGDKQVQAAELRVRLPQTQDVSNVTVEVYHQQTCPQTKRPCPEEEQQQQQQQQQQLMGTLTQSSLVTAAHSWKVFNITSPLLHWLRDKKPNKIRRKRLLSRKRSDKSKRALTPDPSMTERALLVVFSHTDLDDTSKPKASLLHTAEQSKFLSPAEIKQARRHKKRRSKRGQRDQAGSKKLQCRRVDLQVDFNQIGWGSWIIFPKRYNAYRCEGSCPGPLGEDLNPTNHAYMQSLYKHFHPDRVASPCCAPTKMSPLSMLYFENGEMLLRHHEDMIVNECGCQ